MGAFKPLMLPLRWVLPSSIAMWGGAPMKKRAVIKPNKVDIFLFLVSFFRMVDLAE